ncbi:MAG: protein kinase [Clostridia bacterium]|nr:protein kinase [Clostridia bacterium]
MIDKILNERYKIVEMIGSGGMADVYKGVDLESGEDVAIKALKKEYSSDPQYLRRLSREANAMVSLKNEHVVSLIDIGTEDDVHYLVLEYVKGKTLREYMDQNGPIKPHVAVGMMCDVLDGLAHAHQKGLVHRDVKPQNIMITDDGVVKLTDFGIAKFAGNSTKTFDGKEAVGSVYYISPEQAKGEEVDAGTDIYSAGILLYEMLTGDPPFTGDNAVQIALKHVNGEIKPLHEADSHLSIALSDVVARATAKDKSIRYSDATEMIKDLKHALRSPYSRFARIRKKNVAEDVADVIKPTAGVLREHLPLIAIIGAVVLVVALFLILFLISVGIINNNSRSDNGYLKVPGLLGYSENDARIYAENRGFSILVTGYEASDEYSAGEVCAQDPASQTKAREGTVISVIISTGMETVRVPDLLGKTVDEAKRALEAVGLVLDDNIEYQTSMEPVGTVIGQSINPDETVMTGDSVRITVSKEPISVTTIMPDLVGKSISEAMALLADAGIERYRITLKTTQDPDHTYQSYTIIEQNPASGMDFVFNTITVELTMFMESEGDYKAEFSENVTLTAGTNEVVITIETDIGEIVIYREEYESGTYSIPFTARFWESGSFTCVIYVNGEVYTSFNRIFE